MTNVKGFIPVSGSAPTAASDNDRWLPTIPGQRRSTEQKPAPVPGQRTGLGPRPAPPAQRLTADMHPLLREIDWNGHVPTAPYAAPSMTREQVTAALRDAEADGPHERVYDSVVLGQPHAWSAF